MQRVTVLAKGFAWNGKTYRSLSKVAVAITGTNWNGPKFFGLRDKQLKPVSLLQHKMLPNDAMGQSLPIRPAPYCSALTRLPQHRPGHNSLINGIPQRRPITASTASLQLVSHLYEQPAEMVGIAPATLRMLARTPPMPARACNVATDEPALRV